MDSINSIVKKLRESRLLQEKEDYSKYSRDELIARAQNGDQYAFELLVNGHKDFLSMMARSKFTQGEDFDDMYQVATIGFWEAVQRYDPQRSGDFEAYAGMIIKRKLTDELRKEDTDKRRANVNTTSLDATMDADDDSDSLDGMTQGENTGLVDKSRRSGLGVDPQDVFFGNEGAKELLRYMKDNLTDTERKAIMMKIKGYGVSEIAEETGMKYKSVENALLRVKNKLADYLRTRESKKIREVEFSEEEKQILESVLTKINEEGETMTESVYTRWNRVYSEYDPEQFDMELEILEDEFARIEDEAKEIDYEDREDIAEELQDTIDRFSAMEEYLTDEQFEIFKKIYIPNLDEIPYDGDKPSRRYDPYAEVGMRQSDFF